MLPNNVGPFAPQTSITLNNGTGMDDDWQQQANSGQPQLQQMQQQRGFNGRLNGAQTMQGGRQLNNGNPRMSTAQRQQMPVRSNMRR
jgi:hypothetical protein